MFISLGVLVLRCAVKGDIEKMLNGGRLRERREDGREMVVVVAVAGAGAGAGGGGKTDD